MLKKEQAKLQRSRALPNLLDLLIFCKTYAFLQIRHLLLCEKQLLKTSCKAAFKLLATQSTSTCTHRRTKTPTSLAQALVDPLKHLFCKSL